MKQVHYSEIDLETPKEKDAKGVKIRWLISKKDGAENFAMRLFEIQSNGFTPYHQHDWEHEVFILEGKCNIRTADGIKSIDPGQAVFIQPMEWHQFKNTGNETLKFLCLIPYKE